MSAAERDMDGGRLLGKWRLLPPVERGRNPALVKRRE
jgi:hypothetical protein